MQSLGVKVVAAAGIPVQLTTGDTFCDEVFFQPMKSLSAAGTPPVDNVEPIYILNSSTAKGASSTNVLFALLPGQPGQSLRSRTPLGLNLKNIYLDADTSADGALVSYV